MIKILNTKTNKIKEYTEEQAISEFECDTFADKYILKEEYDIRLENLEDEEDKEDLIEYWNNDFRYIIGNKKEYIKEMIEFEEWTSPQGIKSVYKVL